MKKFNQKLCVVLLFVLVVFSISCVEKEKPTIKFEKSSIEMYLNDTFTAKLEISGIEGSDLVKFDVEDDSILSVEVSPTGCTIKALKLGKTTVKATLKSDESISVVINVKVINRVYKVTFKDSDGTILSETQVEHGSSGIAPNSPVKDGFKFKGWDKDFSNITSDLDVTALYEELTYKVTFKDVDGVILSEQFVKKGQSANKPDDPVRQGFEFTGWNKDFSNITSDLDVIATYKTAVIETKKYTVVFKDVDGTVLSEQEIEEGKTAIPVDNPTKEGHTFIGWDKLFANVQSDLVITAMYEVNKYKVVFKADNKILKEETVEYGKSVVAPESPIKEGYTFKEWDKDFSVVKGDLVVNAIYEVNKYKVVFKGLGEILKEETVEYGKSAVAPTDLKKEGYIFKEWDKDFSSVKSDLEVLAVFVKTYNIKYVLNDGTLSGEYPTYFEEGSEVNLPSATKEGYEFLGWTKEAQASEYISKITKDEKNDVVLYAQWKSSKKQVIVGEGGFSTIQAALENIEEGTEVLLLSGTYEENVTINVSNISILGNYKDGITNWNINESSNIKGQITISEGVSDITISGLMLISQTVLMLDGNNENITFTNNFVESTVKNAGSSSDGVGSIDSKGDVSQLVVKNNSFKQMSTLAYPSCIYMGGLVTNAIIEDNYFTNTCASSLNTFGVWLPRVAGWISVSNNNFDRFAGNYWTIWIGQSSVEEYSVIDMNDNQFIGGSVSTEYECGIAVDKVLSDTMTVNIIGNTFKYCKDTIIGVRGTANSDATSDAKVTIMYNKFYGIHYKLRFGLAKTNFYLGKNYGAEAFANSTTDQAIKVESAVDNFTKDTDLDLAYEEYKKSLTTSYSRIVYKLDGGMGIGPSRYVEGDEFELPVPFKEGFNFLGWTLASDSTEYISKISSNMQGGIVLYAKWKEIYVAGNNITFDFDGGVSNELYIANGTPTSKLLLNNYNENSGGYWSDSGYADYIYITTSGSDPTATFSDRVYVGKNKVSGLYEIISIITSGGSSWPAGAEYVITISNSYGKGFAAADAVVKGLKVGQVVGFSRAVNTISSQTPGEVYFYTSEPTSFTLTKKITATDTLIVPSKLGFSFDGWFDSANKQYTSIEDFTEDITVKAKWTALNPVTSIEVKEIPTEMVTGQKSQIVANVLPTDAYFQDLFYESDNEVILQVDEKGMLTAMNAGTAKITITDYVKKQVKEFTITVYSIDSIDATFDDISLGTLKVNDTVNIKAVGYGKNVSKVTFEYQSDNENVVTVSNTGLVCAVGLGVANVTISCVGIDDVKLVVSFNVKEFDDNDRVDALLKLLADNNFSTIEIGNACLFNDGKFRCYDSMYGSVNKYLFDEFIIDTKNVQTAVNNPNCHKARTGLGDIEFVTVHDTATLTGYASTIASNMASGETSIHYVVGDDAIYQVVPEEYIAYHAGDGTGIKFEWIDTGVNATANVAPTFDLAKSGTKYYYVLNGVTTSIEAPISGDGKTISNPTAANYSNLGPVWTVKNNKYYIGTGWACFSQVAAGAIVSRGGNNNSIGIEMAVNTRGDIYDTWQRTARLVADILIRNKLDLTRVKQHNTWSGKNCPQSIIAGDYWNSFMEMVALNYDIATKYNDAVITMVSNNPSIIDNTGRVINPPATTTTVSYTITVKIGDISKDVTLYNIVPGTTIWEQWDGMYVAKEYIWNKGKYAIVR